LPPNKNDIDELGYSLGKQLKALSPDFKSSINADARDVASRPRNARYDSLTNRISGQGYNRIANVRDGVNRVVLTMLRSSGSLSGLS